MSHDTKDTPPLASHVCLALMRIGTRMASGFDRRYEPFGLTQAQFRLLLAAWDLGGQEGAAPSEIADHLLLERATVSVMAQKLVERDLLCRAYGPNRRTHRLVLTPSGGERLREMGDKAIALAEETLAPFAPHEQTVLRDLLIRLETHLRHQTVPAPDPEGQDR